MKKIYEVVIVASIILLTACQDTSKVLPNNKSTISNTETSLNKTKENKTYLEKKTNLDKPINRKFNNLSVFEDNNYIYYCSKEGITKMNKINGESQLILQQTNVGQLFPYENYMYFVKTDEDVKVFRIDKDGNNNLQVFDIKQTNNKDIGDIRQIMVVGDKLYLNCSSYIYSYDMKTKKLQLLVDDADKFAVVKDNIYYIDHAQRTFTIYKKNLKSMKTNVLLGDGKSYPESNIYSDFIFIGDKIYYVTRNPNGLYYNNNGKRVCISDKDSGPIEALMEYNGDIYYLEFANNSDPKFIKFNTRNNTTSQVALLKDISLSQGVKIVNGYVYYERTDYVIEGVHINE